MFFRGSVNENGRIRIFKYFCFYKSNEKIRKDS